MRSHLLFDPLDPYGDLGSGNSDVNFAFSPLGFASGPGNGTGTPAGTPPQPLAPTLPEESVEAMAAISGSGGGGTGSVVAETSSSGFTINLNFDSAAMAAPASFRAGIEQAASILSATITNKITVNINIDYSGTGGGAFAGPTTGQFVSYSTVRSDLIADAAPGDTSFNALPTGSTIQGQSQVAVWNAQLKLFGLISPTATAADGSASFATDISSSLLVGVALHELTHAIGRVPYGQPDGPQPDIFDFYRFTSPGTLLITDNMPASSAYFSLNGGATKIADFGVSSDPSDFLNSGVQGGNDPFNEFYSGSTLQTLTPIDKELLDALGFNTMPLGLAVVSNATDALQGGAAVSLLSSAPNINDPGSTTLASATIKIANATGNAVSGDKLFVSGIENGSLGNGVTASWNATTDTLTLGGTASIATYDTLLSEITFQDTGTDASSGSHPVRTVYWIINDGTNSYNATSTIDIDRAPVAVNNTATDAVGTTLSTIAASGVLSNASDLDGDSLTIAAVSDTAHGAGTVGSALAGTYGHLTLNADGSYSYVADNTAAISSAPIGSHLQDAFTYTVSDGNGGTTTASLTVTVDRAPVVTAPNVILNSGAPVAASSLFSATDPDGNTIKTYAFEDTGSGHFVLNGVVEPNNQEIDVTAAQLSQLTYQAVAGSTNDTVEIRVNDGTLWSSWTSFTVTPSLVIEAVGITSLVEVGNNYFMNTVAGGTGPELKYNGAAVTTGEFGPWTLIAAEATSTGYEVAFKDAPDNAYMVWDTDSNGNYVSAPIGEVSPTSTALESLETSFQQDLNGDGVIGINLPTHVIESLGSTSLVEVGNDFFLNPVGGGTGPELQYGGVPYTAEQVTAGWVVVGAEQIASGYEFALKNAATNQFSIWNTNSSGNFVSYSIYSGSSTALESLETSFHQDLNGDGVIGINLPTTVIESFGSTSLVEIGDNYYLNPVGGGTGPELQYGGVPYTAEQVTAGWVVVGAEQIASGYEFALKNAATNQFSIWNTNSSGNFVSYSIYSGSSTALESLETSFHQDLNGDGVIGINLPTTVIESFGSTSLVEIGDNYYLNPVGGGTGPELQYGGVPYTAEQVTAGWVVVGAEQIASGYEFALKNAATNQFSIWNTNSSGNFVSYSIYSGSSTALESLETSFHQDLNGDGVIGINLPTTVIESFGSTSLVEIGNDFFLNPVGGGTGPELQYGGVPYTAEQVTAGWVVVGAEQIASGYEFALKNAATNQFSIWNTNSSGNFVSYSIYSGSSTALESLETSFHQDLNGDGTIGIPTTSETASATSNGPAMANLHSAASATPDNFQFSSGTSGQTFVASGSQNNAVVMAGHDGFAFVPGAASSLNYPPSMDIVPSNSATPVHTHAAMPDTHGDAFGTTVIPDEAHAAQWLAHHNGFHFV